MMPPRMLIGFSLIACAAAFGYVDTDEMVLYENVGWCRNEMSHDISDGAMWTFTAEECWEACAGVGERSGYDVTNIETCNEANQEDYTNCWCADGCWCMADVGIGSTYASANFEFPQECA